MPPETPSQGAREASRQAWRDVKVALGNPKDLDFEEWAATVMDAVEDYGDAHAATVAAAEREACAAIADEHAVDSSGPAARARIARRIRLRAPADEGGAA